MVLPLPSPGAGEIRVRVHASALNPADNKVALGRLKFLHARNFPMILGYDFSGVIDAVGSDVAWKCGDAVFGFLPYGPFNRRGAFAESLIARGNEVARKPEGVSHAQAAAAATPALTALQAIRDLGRLPASGGRVLITGVSGGVGSTAISVARRLGATVVAVGSGSGLTLARKLNAVEVIDRKQQDVFGGSDGAYDVVFDAAAAYRWGQWKRKLKPGGVYVTTLPSLPYFIDRIKCMASPSKARFVNVKCRPADLDQVARWLEAGDQIAIDSTIPVREVATGLARIDRGEAVGRIVVDVQQGF